MYAHLGKVGSTYYFRQAVPKDLAGAFITNSGQPRTEWKLSLRTKDRETAKRRRIPHEIETDALIDNARANAKSVEQTFPVSPAAQQQELQIEAARLDLAQESQARKAERRHLHRLWHKRRQSSTAELTPEEAAAIDLLREQDAEIEELRQAVATMTAGKMALGYRLRLRANLPRAYQSRSFSSGMPNLDQPTLRRCVDGEAGSLT